MRKFSKLLHGWGTAYHRAHYLLRVGVCGENFAVEAHQAIETKLRLYESLVVLISFIIICGRGAAVLWQVCVARKQAIHNSYSNWAQ